MAKATRNRRIDAKAAETFLAQVAKGATYKDAAAAAGFTRSSFMHSKSGLVARDADFKGRLEESVEAGADELEKEAWRRAVDGVVEPIVSAGKHVTDVRKFSDTLLIVMLKMRGRFNDRRQVEHSGTGGGPIRISNEQVEEGLERFASTVVSLAEHRRAKQAAESGG